MTSSATLALVLLCAGAAAAQEIKISGQAGFGARAVRGEVAPVTVEIENRGPDREIELALTWGAGVLQQQTRVTLPSLSGRRGPTVRLRVTLPSKGRKVVSTPLLAPDLEDAAVWAFAIDGSGQTLAGEALLVRLLPAETRLVAFVGADRPGGLNFPGLETTWSRAEHLPEDPRAYAGLEALVWLDAAVSDVRGPAVLTAIREWVRLGGHLIVARSHTAGLENSPIVELLPVTLKGPASLPSVAALPGLREPLPILQAVPSTGRVRMSEGAHPLIVEGLSGAGRITFVAFDPGRPPLLGWSGLGGFWRGLLNVPDPASALPGEYATPPRSVGSIQLLQQAARFPDVPTPAIGGLFVLILVYILAVGPGDFLVLRKLRRLELTWITFPIIVVVFTLAILVLGGGFLRRSGLQRELAVVDHYPEFERRRALSSILAPSDDVYRFSDAQPLSSNFLSRSISSDPTDELTDITVHRDRTDRVDSWPLNRGATGILFADRSAENPSPVGFGWKDALLEVRNDTGSAIEEAILIVPGGVYRLPTLSPGTRTVEPRLIAQAFDEYVTRDGDPLRPDSPDYRYRGYTRYDDQFQPDVSERQLNLEIRRLLVTLMLPPSPHPAGVHPFTGFARTLSVRPWIGAGGSVLVAWRDAAPSLDVQPSPAKRSAFVMTRYFEGPP